MNFSLKNVREVLKPNGILINYTPDWESQYLNFYDDITHLKPFTKITLENCYRMYGFETSKIEKFYQLPVVWIPNFEIFIKFDFMFYTLKK